jgi:hypothetical protein
MKQNENEQNYKKTVHAGRGRETKWEIPAKHNQLPGQLIIPTQPAGGIECTEGCRSNHRLTSYDDKKPNHRVRLVRRGFNHFDRR